jgi:hypothetical protein
MTEYEDSRDKIERMRLEGKITEPEYLELMESLDSEYPKQDHLDQAPPAMNMQETDPDLRTSKAARVTRAAGSVAGSFFDGVRVGASGDSRPRMSKAAHATRAAGKVAGSFLGGIRDGVRDSQATRATPADVAAHKTGESLGQRLIAFLAMLVLIAVFAQLVPHHLTWLVWMMLLIALIGLLFSRAWKPILVLGILLILITVLAPLWRHHLFYGSRGFSTILVAGVTLFLMGAALARSYWLVLATATIILCLHLFGLLPIQQGGVRALGLF